MWTARILELAEPPLRELEAIIILSSCIHPAWSPLLATSMFTSCADHQCFLFCQFLSAENVRAMTLPLTSSISRCLQAKLVRALLSQRSRGQAGRRVEIPRLDLRRRGRWLQSNSSVAQWSRYTISLLSPRPIDLDEPMARFDLSVDPDALRPESQSCTAERRLQSIAHRFGYRE